MRTLDDYINAAHHLVPAPQVLPQILTQLNRPEVNTDEVVELIAYNQSLTGSVLRLCNSAYYSRGTPIDSLHHAVTHIGFRQVYDIVVSVVTALTYARPQKGYGVEADELWGHSVANAIAAQIVARDCSADQQLVFTAGILHDIGKIVLSLALEDVRDQVVIEAEQGNLSPYDIEMKLLGVNHAEAGGRLLEHWKLPGHLVTAVRHHHQPAGANGNEELTACVYLGNFIAYLMGYGYGKYSLDLRGRDETLEILKLTSEDIPRYMQESFEKLKQVKQLYKIK